MCPVDTANIDEPQSKFIRTYSKESNLVDKQNRNLKERWIDAICNLLSSISDVRL